MCPTLSVTVRVYSGRHPMHLTGREWWGLIHGMGFGAVFLLAFAGGLAGLYSLRAGLVTPQGVVERMRRLKIGVVAMAVAAWGTVLTGTWVVYPWYNAAKFSFRRRGVDGWWVARRVWYRRRWPV